MSVPIGSIEFLVKFDTMSGSFKDALKDAMKDIDLDVEGANIDKIQEDLQWLRWNIATRLRTPLSVDYGVTAVAAPAHVEWAQKEETVKRLAAQLMEWKGEVPLVPRREDEEDEEYTARVRKAAKVILDEYSAELVKILDPETGRDIFLTDPRRYIHISNMLREAIEGTWPNLIKDAVQKLFPETKVKVAAAQMLRVGGAEVHEREKLQSDVEREFGLGGRGLEITSAEDLIASMKRERISVEALKSIFELKPKDYGKASQDLKDFAKTLYEDYTIKVGAQLPNIILRLLQQQAELAAVGGDLEADVEKFWGRTGQRVDIMGWVLKENRKQFYELLRETLPEEEAEELIEEMKDFFKPVLEGGTGGEVYPFGQELKTFYTEAKAAREVKLGKEPKGLRGAIFGAAPYLMNVIDKLTQATIPEMEELVGKEDLLNKDIAELIKVLRAGLEAMGDDISGDLADVKETLDSLESSGGDNNL